MAEGQARRDRSVGIQTDGSELGAGGQEGGDPLVELGAAGAGADAGEVVAGDVRGELGVGLDRGGREGAVLGAEAAHLLEEAGVGGGLGLAADLVEEVGADALDDGIGGAAQPRDQAVGGRGSARVGALQARVEADHVEAQTGGDAGLVGVSYAAHQGLEDVEVVPGVVCGGREDEGEEDDLELGVGAGAAVQLGGDDGRVDPRVPGRGRVGRVEQRAGDPALFAAAAGEGAQGEGLDDLEQVAVVERLDVLGGGARTLGRHAGGSVS